MSSLYPRTLIIEHNDKKYTGHIATIDGTTLGGLGDRGIFNFWLSTSWKGGGVSVGGYAMDEPHKDDDDKFLGRRGTAYGMQLIMDVMETVGVTDWEKIKGEKIIVLFDYSPTGGTWGGQSRGIANLLDESKVLVLSEHAEAYREGLDTDKKTD